MRSSFVRSFLCVIAMATVLGACSDDSTGLEANAEVAGTYTLQTVDGQSLPVVVGTENEMEQVWTSGKITLKSDGSLTGAIDWEDRAIGTNTVINSWTDTFSGTFELDGTSVVVDIADETEDFEGTISGGQFTLNADGRVLVLTK